MIEVLKEIKTRCKHFNIYIYFIRKLYRKWMLKSFFIWPVISDCKLTAFISKSTLPEKYNNRNSYNKMRLAVASLFLKIIITFLEMLVFLLTILALFFIINW